MPHCATMELTSRYSECYSTKRRMGTSPNYDRALSNRVKSIQFSLQRGIHLSKKYPGQTTTNMESSEAANSEYSHLENEVQQVKAVFLSQQLFFNALSAHRSWLIL